MKEKKSQLLYLHLRFQFNSSLLIPLLGLTLPALRRQQLSCWKKTAITWLEAGKIQGKKGQMCGSSITLLLPAAMSSILSDHHTSCKWCQSAAHSITPLLRWKVQISSSTTSTSTTASFISFLCFSHATFGSAIILQVLFLPCHHFEVCSSSQAGLTVFF